MTSSLVGSEMCIRDSFSDLLALPVNIAPDNTACILKLVGAGCASLSSACLLYTSDAADDM
eukprot:9210035-Prorocentrum_lima.AAC.1